MSGPSPGDSPWADPSTLTEPGEPYTGPPSTSPQGPYGYPYGAAPYGYPPGYWYPAPPGPGMPYGYPYAPAHPPAPWGPPGAWGPPAALPPRRPGQVVTSAVLAFVQAGLVVFASLYVLVLSAFLDMAAERPAFPGGARGFAAEADVLAVLQFGSVALLIAVGVLALNRRTRLAWVLLLVGHGVQIALTVYWMVRLGAFFGAIPGPDPGGVLVGLGLFFAAVPLVGAGLVVTGPGRRWFDGGAPA